MASAFDEVAIECELADQWIDLAQTQRQLRVMFQIAAHEVIMARSGFQPRAQALSVQAMPYFFGQVQHAEDAALGFFAQVLMHDPAQSTNVRSGGFGTAQ